jgi:hypothetical protein
MHNIEGVVAGLAAFANDPGERAREMRPTTDSTPPPGVVRTGDLVSFEVVAAHEAGRLDQELLAHSFAIACWAVNVTLHEERLPSEALGFLSDRRLRFVLSFYAPLYA